ncbi:alginate lyase family protein [Nonomuraea soli]|uniref:Alginate lyase domain-containing protein n=1 Tax=Nonomuraea soli TaxID=1032476 RepID=A0A7W0HR86_9ACTN|nr:alginate lyase family protein [Nonomuraea soli]MBA2892690.1 hypothetical protein [Nonomuraea soli]
MRRPIAALAALLVAVAPIHATPASAVTATAGVNLVPNPGFEAATPATEACPAPAWCTPWQSSTYAIDTTVAAEGSRSMRIDGSPTKKIGGFVTVPLNQATTPIVRISAQVKLDAITMADYTDFPGAARVSLNFSYVNSAGTTVYTGSGLLGGILTGTRDWTALEGTFKVPPLTTRVQIINTVQTSTGTMWVDDVRVTPGSAWLHPETATKRAAQGSEATFLVTVTNRRAVADSLRLAVDHGTVTPAVTGELKPGESALVMVKTPASAVLTATPGGDASLAQRATLTVEQATAKSGEPRVYATPAELDALRERIAGQPWAARAFDTTVRAEADAWLARPLDQTVFHGGWSGNFKCPGTNTMLTFDYSSPAAHRCPLDGKTYSGEPYNSAWVEIWHNNAAQAASDLGLAYRMTGKAEYAAKARDILRYYADRFLAVPLNALYGRIHYQSLDEAVAAIGLIDAYDLVRDTLTEAERVDVEGNLLRPLAELLISSPMATSNFQAWTAAAVHGAGAAIDDDALRSAGLADTEFLLDKAIVSDGWWWEGSASYHVYALQALTQVAISARERDYRNDPRFKSMYTTLLPYLHPDQTVPAAGDGGTWGRRFGPNFTMFAEWAYAAYGDPDFAAGLGLAYHNLGTPRIDRWALRFGADEIPKGPGTRQRSTTFRGLGETVLRGGEPANLIPNGDLEEAALDSAQRPAYWKLEGDWDGHTVKGRAGQVFPVDGTRLAHLRLTALGTGTVKLTFLDSRGRTVGSAEGGADVTLDVPTRTRAVRLAIDGAFERLDLWPADLVRDGGFEDGGAGWTRSGTTLISPLAHRGEKAAMAARGRWSSDIPVTGGQVGTVALRARAQGLGTVELSFVTRDGSVTTPVTRSFAGTWKALAIESAVPREAVAARVTLAADRAAGFFDDVALLYGSAVDPFQADALRLDHGIPGGSHGHADKLHLDVTGGGLQSTDLGMVYGSDNADLTNNWYRETVSHNTVIVDGRSQDRAMRGSLTFFGVTPGLRVVDAGAKDGDVAIRRADLMTDRYTLDVFDATGTAAHRYDQSWHGQGTLEVSGPAMTPPPCGDCVLNPADTDFGYHRLKRVAEGTAADGRWQAQWTSDTAVLSLRSLEPVPTGVLHTSGPGEATTGQPIPFLLARREGQARTRFTTLIETRSRADRAAVDDARRVADGHVQVDLAGGLRDDVLFDSGYALLRRTSGGAPVGVDLMRRSSVTVDGVEWVTVSQPIERASVAYAGSDLRLTVPRGTAGRYSVSVHAPGIRNVTLNGEAVSFVRSGDKITVAVTIS